jgi:PadR family transcriptional regulator, regulatory protein PadR
LINPELLKGNTATLVLTALARREMYGYELIKEIEAESRGALALKEGTLYPVLHQLEKEGEITSRWEGKEGERRRRYYRITAAGRKALARRRGEWTAFRALMDRFVAGREALA